MKMYFLCDNQGPQWFVCYGVLENGFVFGSHLCSHPVYAPSDLYFGRKHRIEALKEIFGVRFERDSELCETVVVNSAADVPEWWTLSQKDEVQNQLEPKYELYNQLVKDSKMKIEIKFDDEDTKQDPR